FTVPNPHNEKQPIVVYAEGVAESKITARSVDNPTVVERRFKRYNISLPSVLSAKTNGRAGYALELEIVAGNLSRRKRQDVVTYVCAAAVSAMLFARLAYAVYAIAAVAQ